MLAHNPPPPTGEPGENRSGTVPELKGTSRSILVPKYKRSTFYTPISVCEHQHPPCRHGKSTPSRRCMLFGPWLGGDSESVVAEDANP